MNTSAGIRNVGDKCIQITRQCMLNLIQHFTVSTKIPMGHLEVQSTWHRIANLIYFNTTS